MAGLSPTCNLYSNTASDFHRSKWNTLYSVTEYDLFGSLQQWDTELIWLVQRRLKSKFLTYSLTRLQWLKAGWLIIWDNSIGVPPVILRKAPTTMKAEAMLAPLVLNHYGNYSINWSVNIEVSLPMCCCNKPSVTDNWSATYMIISSVSQGSDGWKLFACSFLSTNDSLLPFNPKCCS